ncbi:NAD(P)H-dependent oxidoreductase [Lutimaribacter saemankumensis]|uniref:NAD(P)H dehydrogenase (Quinone) n=1 Tax=Lutimaribacter saemankumensis TaxID=490829 RepID=A0A1G8KA25_9RHOB|nr:NAD(P)H-dependent oxidoreductase [Lutimaribacter saemankumensis]SDI40326.1 NAD(P)H dehydrogenase (quinone) [Lutimaribacter saemankumensis]
MNVHITLAHPEPTSFNGSLTYRAETYFKRAGNNVTKTDLYASDFDPVERGAHYKDRSNKDVFIPLGEQRAAWKNGTTPEDVRSEIDNLRNADLVILQFPLWWHGPPAILKGWFDRTFPSGGVYTSRMRYDEGYFKGKRAMLSVTTGAPEEAFGPGARGGDPATMLWPLHYSLHYLGFEVLHPFLAHGVQGHGYSYEDHGKAECRLAQKLDSWEDRLAGVWNEAAQSFPGWPDWDHRGQPLS